MIVMAQERFKAAMADLFDSSGLPDVRDVRREELKFACASMYPWFERVYENKTIRQLCLMRIRERNTGFGSQRSRFDELGRVNLSTTERR